jgi:hypothetical protein
MRVIKDKPQGIGSVNQARRSGVSASFAALILAAVTFGGAPAVHANPEAPNPSLPYGPYTCAQSLVWREATAGDYVCVPPSVRTRAKQDNNAAASRVQPGGGAYGPDTCKPGWVWR